MLWIKSYQATDRDPKTRKFCRATGLDTPTAVGSLHMFWWWALDWAPSGDISQFEPIDIAEAVGFKGEPGVLFSALLEAGYVAKTMEGHEIVNWHEIGGQIIEARKKDALRKAEARKKRDEKKARPPDVHEKSGGQEPDNPGQGPEVRSIEKELDLDKDLELNKDLKIDGQAEPKADQDPKQDQNQEQNPPAEPTTDKSAAPDESGKSENPGKKEPKTRKKPEYPPESPYMRMAVHWKSLLDALAKSEGVATLTPRANLQSWADDFRKLVELDGQDDKQQIADVMNWVVKDKFWKSNVLSGETFREKYPTLLLQMNESKKTATGNKGSGGGGRGYGHQKPAIPIYEPDPSAGKVSDEEFAKMMAYAAELQAKNEQERRERGAFNNR